jgi:hypothetical protein
MMVSLYRNCLTVTDRPHKYSSSIECRHRGNLFFSGEFASSIMNYKLANHRPSGTPSICEGQLYGGELLNLKLLNIVSTDFGEVEKISMIEPIYPTTLLNKMLELRK